MGARTGSRLIELSEDSMGRSPLFIYSIVFATSVVGVAATDMVAESSAQDDYHCHPDQLYRDPWSAEVIPATVAIPIHVTPQHRLLNPYGTLN